MAILVLEAIGSRGEELALAAADETGIAVGYDEELACATFDSDEHDEQGLEAALAEVLDGSDPDWRSHLRVAE